MYKPLGRCVVVIDDKVEALNGAELDKYFASHGIEYETVYSGNEADKDIRMWRTSLSTWRRMPWPGTSHCSSSVEVWSQTSLVSPQRCIPGTQHT